MLRDYLQERLDKAGVSLDEYQELCLRLLNYGVLCRDESQIEQQLYDRAFDYLKQSRYDEAIAAFEEALHAFSDHVFA